MNNPEKDSQDRIRELEFELEMLKAGLTEKEELIEAVYASKTWRLAQLYGRLFGVESLWRGKLTALLSGFFRLKRQNLRLSERVLDSIHVTEVHYNTILEFINKDSSSKGIFIIVAAPRIRDGIGLRGYQITHRAIKLASEFSKEGFKIVYVSTASREGMIFDRIESINDNVIQMNIQLFFKLYNFLFENCAVLSAKKMLLIQDLHPYIIDILSHANAYNWTTVYDILDNWEEFSKVGWIDEWYSKGLEGFVVNNSDIKITVSYFLQRKFRYSKNVFIVHNGYTPHMLSDSTRNLDKGEITVGYLGDLQKYRFDWRLLLSLAKRQKGWLFYLIGNLPENIRLCDNIISLGTVDPPDIYSYARNWDVAIIPFKENNLTISCDNLKVYEYLCFRLPVVARGIGEHVGDYPYVYIAETEQDFEEHIKLAASIKIEEDKIADFLKKSDWTSRAKEMLGIIQSNKSLYKEYIFEDSIHS